MNGESLSRSPTSSRLISTISDYNYVREGNRCVPVGPEPIPAGVCVGDAPNQTYQGSSGYRLIPGNTCRKDNGGVIKDAPVTKSCDQGEPPHIANFQTKFPQLNLKKGMSPIKLCVFGVVIRGVTDNLAVQIPLSGWTACLLPKLQGMPLCLEGDCI